MHRKEDIDGNEFKEAGNIILTLIIIGACFVAYMLFCDAVGWKTW